MGDRWSLCSRPAAAPGNRNIILQSQGACPSIRTTPFTSGKPLKRGAYPWDLLIQPCKTEKAERTFYRGALDAGIEDGYLDLHKLHAALHQRQSHEDESIRVSAQADFGLVFSHKSPRSLFGCHTIWWEQNLLAQLPKSNCRLITCAGMWLRR